MLNQGNLQPFKVERDDEPALFFSICFVFFFFVVGGETAHEYECLKTAFSCFVDIDYLVWFK